MIAPPPPMSRAAFEKRLGQLQAEFPERRYFSPFEVDARLYGWFKTKDRWLAVASITLAIGGVSFVGTVIWALALGQ